jgi:hypothetical protein
MGPGVGFSFLRKISYGWGATVWEEQGQVVIIQEGVEEGISLVVED